MSTLAAPKSSHNPFRSNPSTPDVTGSSSAPPPVTSSAPSSKNPTAADVPLSPPSSLSARSSPPLPAIPPDHDLLGITMEDPPAYTARPSVRAGESTVEQGPSRPFQPAPQRPIPNNTGSGLGWAQNFNTRGSSTRRRGGGSLIHQLSSTITEVVNNFQASVNAPPRSGPNGQSGYQWSSYPGLQPQPQQRPPPGPPPQQSQSYRAPSGPPPPPQHPSSLSPSSPPRPPPRPTSAPPSDFARDFYAAGPGAGLDSSLGPSQYAPPPGPPPLPQRPTSMDDHSSGPTTTGNTNVPDDGRPTTYPLFGHPLLHDGMLLVYPKGHECDKCHNIGYKHADPLRPCKKCWHKYGKPFSGPLAYSFSSSPGDALSISNSQSSSSHRGHHNHNRRLHRRARSNSSLDIIETGNFQRPLPHPTTPAFSLPPPTANYAPGGYPSNSNSFPARYADYGGYSSYGNTRAIGGQGPPPGAVVYTAGDPRIGGRLCWNCNGRGRTSILILELPCDVCGGVGRTF